MWSDTLLAAERSHLIRIVIWAVTSAVLGTTFVTIIAVRRRERTDRAVVRDPDARVGFGSSSSSQRRAGRRCQCAMYPAATRLDRLTWFAIGIDVGIVGAGVTAVLMAWQFTRNLRAFGGGLGVVVQGLGLLVLDLTFASILARLV